MFNLMKVYKNFNHVTFKVLGHSVALRIFFKNLETMMVYPVEFVTTEDSNNFFATDEKIDNFVKDVNKVMSSNLWSYNSDKAYMRIERIGNKVGELRLNEKFLTEKTKSVKLNEIIYWVIKELIQSTEGEFVFCGSECDDQTIEKLCEVIETEKSKILNLPLPPRRKFCKPTIDSDSLKIIKNLKNSLEEIRDLLEKGSLVLAYKKVDADIKNLESLDS